MQKKEIPSRTGINKQDDGDDFLPQLVKKLGQEQENPPDRREKQPEMRAAAKE